MDCMGVMSSQECFNVTDSEESKASTEQTIQKFLEVSRRLETFFLQKRFLLSIHKPELVLKEDISELKSELQRKEQLLQRHHEHLQQWQLLLARAGGTGGQPGPQQGQGHPPQGQQAPVQGQAPAPVQPQVMPPPPAQGNYPQGPLAFLEQTTSNIGMPERR